MAITTFTAAQVLTAAQMNAVQGNDFNQTVSTKTANYVLVAADKGTRVVMNVASANTITVNTSLFSAGDTLVIQNIGAGVSTVTAGTATVSSAGPLAIPQYGSGTLYFTSAGVAIFFPSAGPAPTSGLTFVARTTVSASATLSMTNVFNSTYDNYLVQFSNLTTDTIQKVITMRLGTTGTADSGTEYSFATTANFNGTLTGSETESVSGWNLVAGTGITADLSQANFTVSGPNLARATTIGGIYMANGFSSVIYINLEVFGGMKETSTQYTDWFLAAPSGFTMSGTCTIYGYANS
jgi:hypothetical protein